MANIHLSEDMRAIGDDGVDYGPLYIFAQDHDGNIIAAQEVIDAIKQELRSDVPTPGPYMSMAARFELLLKTKEAHMGEPVGLTLSDDIPPLFPMRD